jgi:hypothetical protein
MSRVPFTVFVPFGRRVSDPAAHSENDLTFGGGAVGSHANAAVTGEVAVPPAPIGDRHN